MNLFLYSHKTRNVSVKEGQKLSYNEILKIRRERYLIKESV